MPDNDSPREEPMRMEGAVRPIRQPSTPQEVLLAACWQRVLNFQPIGADDNFLQLGGTSVQAVAVVAEILKSTNHRLRVRDVLAADRLSDLAANIPLPAR